MSPSVALGIIGAYYLTLYAVSLWTNRKSDADSFFTGNHSSPWYVVAFGMIGAALSGVTFASLPGTVIENKFYYSQFLLGNLAGYVFIGLVLIPLYYKHKLVSIYGYLKERFGYLSYKSGAAIFLMSQSLGASLRLLLAMIILEQLIFGPLGVPLWISTYLILFLMWLYTNKSGIKTIVWTDTIQTFFLLFTVCVTIGTIYNALSPDTLRSAWETHEIVDFVSLNFQSSNNFFKQFVAGFFVAVAMMGLDQFMIQKSLTCASAWEAQKNVLSFSFIVFVSQLLFLFLGFFLVIYAEQMGIRIPEKTDRLFSTIATFEQMPAYVIITFILGLAAATFSSADSAMTALTTTITYDFLKIGNYSGQKKNRIKNLTHIAVTIYIGLLVLLFSSAGKDIYTLIFIVAGYTYGPLLALFMLGIYTKSKPKDKWVPFICVVSPLLTIFIERLIGELYAFNLGFMNIALNACLAAALLMLSSSINNKNAENYRAGL